MSYLTVGRLREAIKDLPDDAPVLYERIEDVYFDKHGWKAELKPGEFPEYPSQYIRAFTSVKYKEDDALYITAHY